LETKPFFLKEDRQDPEKRTGLKKRMGGRPDGGKNLIKDALRLKSVNFNSGGQTERHKDGT